MEDHITELRNINNKLEEDLQIKDKIYHDMKNSYELS